MKEIRLVIADADKRFVVEAASALAAFPEIRIIGHCGDGYELMEMIEEMRPDAVLTEIVLRGMDALSLMKKFADADDAPAFIVCTDFCNAFCIRTACRMGARAFLSKPVNAQSLGNTIISCCDMDQGGISKASVLDRIEEAAEKSTGIAEILVNIGISQDSEGFRFLKDAVELVRRQPEAISSMTKVLYPEIARINNTTPACAERNIRTAIQKAHTGAGFCINGRKPTNREMIAYLAEA